MKHRAYILTPVLACLFPFVAYAGPVDAKRYVSARKSLANTVSLETVKSVPTSCAGKIVEVRGRLSGTFSKDGADSLMLTTADHGSFVVWIDKLPEDNPGVALACLAVMSESGELNAHAWTYDVELRRYEESLKPAPRVAPKPTPKPAPTPTTAESTVTKPAAVTVKPEQLVAVYKKWVKEQNSRLSEKQADTIARSILNFSYHYKVDARLVCAVILAESHFRISATSRAGARGLGQLMPTTAAGLGVDNAYDPEQNVYGSTRYIRSMLDRVSGNKRWNELSWSDLALALAAYNAGPGAVKKHGGIPPYRETQNYVRKVVDIYRGLCGVR